MELDARANREGFMPVYSAGHMMISFVFEDGRCAGSARVLSVRQGRAPWPAGTRASYCSGVIMEIEVEVQGPDFPAGYAGWMRCRTVDQPGLTPAAYLEFQFLEWQELTRQLVAAEQQCTDLAMYRDGYSACHTACRRLQDGMRWLLDISQEHAHLG